MPDRPTQCNCLDAQGGPCNCAPPQEPTPPREGEWASLRSELLRAQEVAGWAQAVLTALNVGDVQSESLLHKKLREVMIAYRAEGAARPAGAPEKQCVCHRGIAFEFCDAHGMTVGEARRRYDEAHAPVGGGGVEALREALTKIVEHYDMAADMYTNDADLAANLAAFARAALGGA